MSSVGTLLIVNEGLAKSLSQGRGSNCSVSTAEKNFMCGK